MIVKYLQLIIILIQRNCLMVYKMLEVSEILEWMTSLYNLIEASKVLSKFHPILESIFGQASWACLSYWSLEGGTIVQQITIWLQT